MSSKTYTYEAEFQLTNQRTYGEVISSVSEVEYVGKFKANGWLNARETGYARLRFLTEREMVLAQLSVL